MSQRTRRGFRHCCALGSAGQQQHRPGIANWGSKVALLAVLVCVCWADKIVTSNVVVSGRVTSIEPIFVRIQLASGAMRVVKREDVLEVRAATAARRDSLLALGTGLSVVLDSGQALPGPSERTRTIDFKTIPPRIDARDYLSELAVSSATQRKVAGPIVSCVMGGAIALIGAGGVSDQSLNSEARANAGAVLGGGIFLAAAGTAVSLFEKSDIEKAWDRVKTMDCSSNEAEWQAEREAFMAIRRQAASDLIGRSCVGIAGLAIVVAPWVFPVLQVGFPQQVGLSIGALSGVITILSSPSDAEKKFKLLNDRGYERTFK